ncbi:MAG: PaaI family thioesterase [candidate division WOR-3 bacterium]
MELKDTQTCFACGKNNPDGLKLPIEVDETGARFTYKIPRKYEGWSGIAHGGIIATLLDELMAWAVRPRGYRTVTAEMTVRFRKPVPVEKEISGSGWIISEDGRLVFARSQLVDTNGTILAEATGKLWKI